MPQKLKDRSRNARIEVVKIGDRFRNIDKEMSKSGDSRLDLGMGQGYKTWVENISRQEPLVLLVNSEDESSGSDKKAPMESTIRQSSQASVTEWLSSRSTVIKRPLSIRMRDEALQMDLANTMQRSEGLRLISMDEMASGSFKRRMLGHQRSRNTKQRDWKTPRASKQSKVVLQNLYDSPVGNCESGTVRSRDSQPAPDDELAARKGVG